MPPDRRVLKDPKETPGPRALRANLVRQGRKARKDRKDQKDPLDLQACLQLGLALSVRTHF